MRLPCWIVGHEWEQTGFLNYFDTYDFEQAPSHRIGYSCKNVENPG